MSDSDSGSSFLEKRKTRRIKAIMKGLTRQMCRQKYANSCRMTCYKKGIPARRPRKPRTAKAQAWHDEIRAALDAQVGKKSLKDALRTASRNRNDDGAAAAPVSAPVLRRSSRRSG